MGGLLEKNQSRGPVRGLRERASASHGKKKNLHAWLVMLSKESPELAHKLRGNVTAFAWIFFIIFKGKCSALKHNTPQVSWWWHDQRGGHSPICTRQPKSPLNSNWNLYLSVIIELLCLHAFPQAFWPRRSKNSHSFFISLLSLLFIFSLPHFLSLFLSSLSLLSYFYFCRKKKYHIVH